MKSDNDKTPPEAMIGHNYRDVLKLYLRLYPNYKHSIFVGWGCILVNPRCKKCGKVIRRKLYKESMSFDVFHKQCKEKQKSIIIIDELSKKGGILKCGETWQIYPKK